MIVGFDVENDDLIAMQKDGNMITKINLGRVVGNDGKSPYIGTNNNWFYWDDATKSYKDSGVPASGGSKIRIDYLGGNNFYKGSTKLNFDDLYRMHLTGGDFVFIIYNDRAYLCSYVNYPSGNALKEMRFESVINSDNRTKVSSIYVISNDGISIVNTTVSDINSENSSNKVTEITESNVNENTYPSTLALKRYVTPLSESIADLVPREITNDFSDADTYVDRHYIRSDGQFSEEIDGWLYTKPFMVEKGCKLTVTGRGYRTDVAIVSQYADGTYTPLIKSIDSTVREYVYVANENMLLVVSLSSKAVHSLKYTTRGINDKVNSLEESVSKNTSDIELLKLQIDYTRILKNFAGIGDSLMSGEIYDVSENKRADCYDSSWLSFLSKYNNAKWFCYSQGGLTTKSWIESHWKTDFESLTELPDAVFIALGTNDKNQQSTIPTGSISDTIETNSYCGLFKRIISIAHNKCPNAKIYCCSLYGNTDQTEVLYSNLVHEISDLYSYCYYIDIANNIKISRKTNDVYAEESHFSTVGYMVVANLVHNLLNDSITKNIEDYKYHGLYNRLN